MGSGCLIIPTRLLKAVSRTAISPNWERVANHPDALIETRITYRDLPQWGAGQHGSKSIWSTRDFCIWEWCCTTSDRSLFSPIRSGAPGAPSVGVANVQTKRRCSEMHTCGKVHLGYPVHLPKAPQEESRVFVRYIITFMSIWSTREYRKSLSYINCTV